LTLQQISREGIYSCHSCKQASTETNQEDKKKERKKMSLHPEVGRIIFFSYLTASALTSLAANKNF